MKLKIWQVDAFASKPLEGNPAAIVPLESWLDAGLDAGHRRREQCRGNRLLRENRRGRL